MEAKVDKQASSWAMPTDADDDRRLPRPIPSVAITGNSGSRTEYRVAEMPVEREEMRAPEVRWTSERSQSSWF